MTEERSEEMERLIESEKSFLWSQSLRITRKTEDAEDLLQETLMKACKGFDSFERDTNFRAWTRKIMINTHINKTRRKTSNTLSLEDAYLDYENILLNNRHQAPDAGDPEKVFFRNHISEAVMELFYSLPDEFRTVFSLYHFDGYTYEEISKALNVPVGTVKSRICRARRHLAERIRRAKFAGITMQ